MKIPKEFDVLATRFYADGLKHAKSEDEWITSRARGLDASEKAVVRSFLDDILEKNLTGIELRQIWHATNSDLLFPNDEHLRRFLSMIRDKLASSNGE